MCTASGPSTPVIAKTRDGHGRRRAGRRSDLAAPSGPHAAEVWARQLTAPCERPRTLTCPRDRHEHRPTVSRSGRGGPSERTAGAAVRPDRSTRRPARGPHRFPGRGVIPAPDDRPLMSVRHGLLGHPRDVPRESWDRRSGTPRDPESTGAPSPPGMPPCISSASHSGSSMQHAWRSASGSPADRSATSMCRRAL
jgi:hypothetical protein